LVDVAGDVSRTSSGNTKAAGLRADAVHLNGHPAPGVQAQVRWSQETGTWDLRLPLGRGLSPGKYTVQIEGEGPGEKPFQYEWEFRIRDEQRKPPPGG